MVSCTRIETCSNPWNHNILLVIQDVITVEVYPPREQKHILIKRRQAADRRGAAGLD
mgnify:CR=1 FL=1